MKDNFTFNDWKYKPIIHKVQTIEEPYSSQLLKIIKEYFLSNNVLSKAINTSVPEEKLKKMNEEDIEKINALKKEV